MCCTSWRTGCASGRLSGMPCELVQIPEEEKEEKEEKWKRLKSTAGARVW